jgi:hypothetical protein
VVFSRKVTDALASPTIHGSGRDVRLVCHDRLMSLVELLSGGFSSVVRVFARALVWVLDPHTSRSIQIFIVFIL